MRKTKISFTNNLLGLRILSYYLKRYVDVSLSIMKKNIPELKKWIQLLNIFHNAEDVKTLGYIFDVCIFAFYVFTRFLFAPSPTLIIAMSATLAQTDAPDLCAAQRSTRRSMKNLRAQHLFEH